MCNIELIGFSDPDQVERDLKKRFAGTSYYDKLTYVPQKKMSFFLCTDNPSPCLRLSVDQVLEKDELHDFFARLDKDYRYQVIAIVSVPEGKTFEEVLLEIALRTMPVHR
jgi:hypothetical protein